MAKGPGWIGYLQWRDGYIDICKRRTMGGAMFYARLKLKGWPNPPENVCVSVRKVGTDPPKVEKREKVLIPALNGLGGSRESQRLSHHIFTAGALRHRKKRDDEEWLPGC